MSKKKKPRALPETAAKAITRSIRTSSRKLNEVAAEIRGMKTAKALAYLTFSRRRIAGTVKKTLESAIANAENNHDLDIDDLVVAEAFVGKNIVMKRFTPRARGRAAQIQKHFSELTIVVREQPQQSEGKTA
jgi:large subunit ribosomal protein L22